MSAFRLRHAALLTFIFLVGGAPVVTQTTVPRSVITIHVGKTGLFSAFGHEHTVTAPIASGNIDAKALSVRITVLSRQLKVMDTDVSEKERAEVQATMGGPKVLDTERYPEIRFQSSRVQPAGRQTYRVTGTLTLHGVSRDLTFDVTGTPDHYQGKTKFKQTEFGIKPVTVGGGSVKVKDELEINLDVYPADFAASASR